MNIHRTPEYISTLYLLSVYLLEAEERLRFNKIGGMYPDVGQLARYKYPKHLEFFAAGRRFRQRAFMAANRVGKTEGGGGPYRDWETSGYIQIGRAHV